MKTLILEPTGSEVVRPCFAYDGYLFYAHLRELGEKVRMVEDATVPMIIAEISEFNPDRIIVHYWNYTQDTVINWIDANVPNVHFFGYKPLIEKRGLEEIIFSDQAILSGMKHLPEVLDEFRYGLFGDCDAHLASNDMINVSPLFLSYACPNRCEFCPIPPQRKGCNPARLELSIPECREVLTKMKNFGYTDIHFFDEDFFMNVPRAEAIIDLLIEIGGFRYICLSAVNIFSQFFERVGEEKLAASGFRVVELGLETVDPDLRKKMNKTGSTDQVYDLLDNEYLSDKIFFLTISLFPGETIASMRATGDFLRQRYHQKMTDRIQTNSTYYGLGQFYQLYDGALGEESLRTQGIIIDEQSCRLSPSFIPNSFGSQRPVQTKWIEDNEKFIFGLYNLDLKEMEKIPLMGNDTIFDIVGNDKKKLIYIMLLARLGKAVNLL